MNNSALLDKIFAGRLIERFLAAHLGEALSVVQITGARGMDPTICDHRNDTICELVRSEARGKIEYAGDGGQLPDGTRNGLWRCGERLNLMLTPDNSTIDNPTLRHHTQVWCAGKRLPVDDADNFQMLDQDARGPLPLRCYFSYENRSISFWPEVTEPVEIIVRGFRPAWRLSLA